LAFLFFSEHHLYFKLSTGFDFDFNNTFPFLKGVTINDWKERGLYFYVFVNVNATFGIQKQNS